MDKIYFVVYRQDDQLKIEVTTWTKRDQAIYAVPKGAIPIDLFSIEAPPENKEEFELLASLLQFAKTRSACLSDLLNHVFNIILEKGVSLHNRVEAPSPEEILRRIVLHKNQSDVHPLTCGNDSRHPDLVPQIENGKVVLICMHEGCNYRQVHIPIGFQK